MSELLKPGEVAALIKVKPVTVYAWASRGILPHFKLEGVIRFSREDILEFIRQRRIEAKRL